MRISPSTKITPALKFFITTTNILRRSNLTEKCIEHFLSLLKIKIHRLRWIRFGGGGEIRTHDPVARVTVFKTVALDHSATPPIGDIVSKKR